MVAAGLMWKMLVKLGAKEKVETKEQRQGYAYMTMGWMIERDEQLRRERLEDYGRAAYLGRPSRGGW